MRLEETSFNGLYLIKEEPHADERGFFSRVLCQEFLRDNGLSTNVVQINMNYCEFAGTLRGLHYQNPPYSETKIVRCVKGRVYDVVIDLRQGSDTFGQYYSIELFDGDLTQLYIPKGFAHGYQALEPKSQIIYFVDSFYQPSSEAGIRYDDTPFNIKWPLDIECISDKDRAIPDYNKEELIV